MEVEELIPLVVEVVALLEMAQEVMVLVGVHLQVVVPEVVLAVLAAVVVNPVVPAVVQADIVAEEALEVDLNGVLAVAVVPTTHPARI
jgi:hypothetical protein